MVLGILGKRKEESIRIKELTQGMELVSPMTIWPGSLISRLCNENLNSEATNVKKLNPFVSNGPHFLSFELFMFRGKYLGLFSSTSNIYSSIINSPPSYDIQLAKNCLHCAVKMHLFDNLWNNKTTVSHSIL